MCIETCVEADEAQGYATAIVSIYWITLSEWAEITQVA